MSITTVRSRIVDLMKDYAVTNAVDHAKKITVHRYLPRQLNAADCPAIVVIPGEAAHSRPSSEQTQDSRVYRVRMYVAPTAQGVSNEVEERAEWFIDDVRNYLNGKQRLELNDSGLEGVFQALTETDGGITEAQYPVTSEAPYYLMVEWRLRVVTREGL